MNNKIFNVLTINSIYLLYTIIPVISISITLDVSNLITSNSIIEFQLILQLK